ncbi:uncharacterized protein LOC124368618 [Homalodisca vitripennis]|uniref:uncharacterized protein LOC124368618 n=1 Tax=Homalodisca vitripennis TaxID=197043 RepID=UPI001EEA9FB4|nr:uncharacterized protein LOC124368618 [Homalodisca vitripennis]KAG8330512.1 hypothetical protein J6590_061912 [Homalodisca vitripennis]
MLPRQVYDRLRNCMKYAPINYVISGLTECPALVTNQKGHKAALRDIIRNTPATLLFYGSSCSKDTAKILPELKLILEVARQRNRKVEIVYIPVYCKPDDSVTYVPNCLGEAENFKLNHGDWWMMDYPSQESLVAVYMHSVVELPTIIVLNNQGIIVDDHAHQDIKELSNLVLLYWF